MKKILFVLIAFNLLLPKQVKAQETEFAFTQEKGMTDYIVTPVEGKTAPEIYKKVIEWIKVTYKDPDKVILSTIENEYIRFEGASGTLYSYNSLLGRVYENTKYQIEISIQNGRYKFDIIGMQCYALSSASVAGGWYDNAIFNKNMQPEGTKMFFKKDGSFKGMWKYIPDVPKYFNELNLNLKESITSNIKKSEGW